jgi:hypothetical protein
MWILITILLCISVVLVYNYVRDINLLRTVTQLNRGTWSERNFVLRLLKVGLPSNTIFHDLYIKKNNGTYSQIDIVIVTDVGVIVVEVKHYSGWIYGMGNREKWVQVFNYGKKKYSFYNPIFQNELHIQSLKNKLNPYDNIPFYSLIVFYGRCELKKISNIPETTKIVKSENVMDIIRYFLQNTNSSNPINTSEIFQILNEGVKNGGDKEIQFQHFENLKKYSEYN